MRSVASWAMFDFILDDGFQAISSHTKPPPRGVRSKCIDRDLYLQPVFAVAWCVIYTNTRERQGHLEGTRGIQTGEKCIVPERLIGLLFQQLLGIFRVRDLSEQF